MEVVIIGHLLGDFYIQTNRMAEKKKTSVRYVLLHCLLYMMVMFALAAWLTGDLFRGFYITMIIGVSHLCVDSLKMYIESKYTKAARYEYVIFLLDQMIHIFILVLVCGMFRIHIDIDKYLLISENKIIPVRKAAAIFIAALICWRPAAIFISLVFKQIPNTIEEADNVQENKKEPGDNGNAVNETIRIGSWIGILERQIILLLGLLGQYGAIGFVLTAKSLARYKQLENKAFAEKYLVGTLLSALIAIVSVSICLLAG